MMTTKNKKLRAFFLIIFLICNSLPLFCDSSKWTIAAQKFKYARGQKEGALQEGTATMLPSIILENLNRSLQRNVMPDEMLERERYKLRTERQSLYLQLSSEYKKRDSLVLNNYSDAKLRSSIKAEEKKIAEIQKKIDANLESLKKQIAETEATMDLIAQGQYTEDDGEDTELEKFQNLFRNIFKKDKNFFTPENIVFYRNDIASVFSPSENAAKEGPLGASFAKEAYSAGINSLITGTITAYGDYISVTVELYIYPGAEKAGSVTEVGSMQELELISSSIAMQLLPLITNAMPVEIQLEIGPEKAASIAQIYIDDVLQTPGAATILLDSGVHNIQFIAENYRTASTNYYFQGNTKYLLKVAFEELKDGFLTIGLRAPVSGDLLMNGERAEPVAPGKSKIAIDGNPILGEFVTEDGATSFFYVQQKNIHDGSFVTIKPKPMDRMAYIDKRRKWMYGSYSLFMLSLIPAFYANGTFRNKLQMYNNQQLDYDEAKVWQDAYNITRIVAVGCGVFWGFELVRYLIAANSVLPQNARAAKEENFVYNWTIPEPAVQAEEAEKTENTEGPQENQTEEKNQNNQIENAENAGE